jgi:hypothetical protein
VTKESNEEHKYSGVQAENRSCRLQDTSEKHYWLSQPAQWDSVNVGYLNLFIRNKLLQEFGFLPHKMTSLIIKVNI